MLLERGKFNPQLYPIRWCPEDLKLMFEFLCLCRKALPGWTQHVRVSPGVGLEGPLDDGFSWRKYGQKDILNAKYPR